MKRQLVFIYNANKDPISAIADYAQKLLKPSTYQCELCSLTHHNFGERSAWKKFRERANAELDFMYLREFEETFNLHYSFPVILERMDGGFRLIFGKGELQNMKSVEELVEKLEKELA